MLLALLRYDKDLECTQRSVALLLPSEVPCHERGVSILSQGQQPELIVKILGWRNPKFFVNSRIPAVKYAGSVGVSVKSAGFKKEETFLLLWSYLVSPPTPMSSWSMFTCIGCLPFTRGSKSQV